MLVKTRFLTAICTGAIAAAALMSAAPAFAASTFEVDGTNGIYKIYSLLNGDPADAGSMKFSSTSFPLSAWALAYGSGDMGSTDAANWIAENVESDEVLAALGDAAEKEGSSAAKISQNEPLTLPSGYYLVTGKNIKPKIVALPDGDEVKTHVKLAATSKFSSHIMVENGYSSFAMDTSDAGAGHRVIYRLESEIPSDYENYETFFYSIIDKLPECASADTSKIDVMYCSNSDVLNVTSAAKISVNEDNVLEVKFDNLKEIVAELEDDAAMVVEFPVRISFTGIKSGKEETNKNEAWCVCGETEETANETEHGTSSFYSYKVTLIAENEEHEALEGASFVLADVDGHYLCEDGTTTDDAGRAKTFESGENGKVEIEGLGSGKFVLCQTKAPEGYDGLPSISLHIMSDLTGENAPTLDVKAACEGQIKIKGVNKDTDEIEIIATLGVREAEGAWTPGTVDANSFDEATANSTSDQFKPSFPTLEIQPLALAAIAAIIISIIIIVSSLISRRAAKSTGKHPEYNAGQHSENEEVDSAKAEIEDNLANGEQTPLTVQIAPIKEYPDETPEDRAEYDGLLANIAEDTHADPEYVDEDLIDDDEDEKVKEFDDDVVEDEEETGEVPQPVVTIQPMSKPEKPQTVEEETTPEVAESKEVQSQAIQQLLRIEIPEDKYVAPEIASAVMESFDKVEEPETTDGNEDVAEEKAEPEVAEQSSEEVETDSKKTVDDFEKLMDEYRRLKEEIEGTIEEIENDS